MPKLKQLFADMLFCSTVVTALAMYSTAGAEMNNPVLLIPFAALTIFKFKNENLSCVQNFIILYFIELVFAALTDEYFTVSRFNLSISFSFLLTVFLVISYLWANDYRCGPGGELIKSWCLVFGIFLVHMSVLYLLLVNFYGFGYERNGAVISRICLHCVIFITCWKLVNHSPCRRITGIFFVIYLCLKSAGGL